MCFGAPSNPDHRMSTPENPVNKPATDLPQSAPTPGLDETIQRLWAQYGRVVIAVCVIVLLAILGKGVLDYMAAQKETEIRQSYAAADTPEKLKAFIAAQSGHGLAGVAALQLADGAYTEGRGAEAVSQYEAAVKALAGTPLSSRAQLGRAMSLILAGRGNEGETALRELADRTSEATVIRAEAAYHLATLAQTAGRSEEVSRLVGQIVQIDPSSPWTQRALMLSMGAAPQVQVEAAKTEAAPAAEGSAIQLNLPGGN